MSGDPVEQTDRRNIRFELKRMSSSDKAAPSDSGVLPEGTRLNETYEIDAFLKAGGMGEVYKGHEIQTGEAVAIKVIREQMAGEENISEIFRREAKVLRRIHHEAVVRYFGFAMEPQLRRHYLAMEFVEGTQLSELLRAGPLPVSSVLALMRRLASGLQAAHDQNVVHRDVSPDNVIIPDAGIAKARLIDFGIAHSLRVEDATVIGGFAGKYKYASPEQLFGDKVSSASDIYSLGLVLAQCLLGVPLNMGGAQFHDVMEKRRSVPVLSGIDPLLRPMIAKMLQPDPAARPKSMAEVAAWSGASAVDATVFLAPKSWSDSPSQRTDGAPIKSRVAQPTTKNASSLRPLAMGGALLLVVGLGAWFALRPSLLNTPTPNKDNGAGLTSTTGATPPTPVDDLVRIRDFTREFDGGDCFFAVAGAVTGGAAEINGIGRSNEPFDAMAKAFRHKFGFPVDISIDNIQAPQCSALAFAKRFTGTDEAPRFDVARIIRSGERLEGAIETDASHVLFLIVEDNGLVTDLSSWLGRDGERRDFALELRSPRPFVDPIPVLLVAIAGSKPMPIGQQAGKVQAQGFFAKLAEGLASTWPRPAVAVSYLSLVSDH